MGRNHEIRVKFALDELQRVKSKAKELGISVSDFIRLLCLKSQVEIKNL